MRTHHCLTAFLCGAFLLGTGKADAQTPPGNAGYPQFSPRAAIDAPAVPAGYAYPYPAISPFDHVFESTYNDHGQWITERSNDSYNKYSFSLEAIVARIKGPTTDPVGYEERPLPGMYFNLADDEPNSLDNFMPGNTSRNLNFGQTVMEFNGGRGPHSSFDSGLIDQIHASGMRGAFTVERPDGIGFELTGIGIFPNFDAADTGHPIKRIGPEEGAPDNIRYLQDGIIGVPNNPGGSIDEENLLANRVKSPDGVRTDIVDLDSVGAFNPGMRLNDGGIIGTIQRFDSYVRTEMHTELYGGGAAILHSASRKVGPFTFRPTVGVRYLFTNELFRFEGHDSGLDYSVDFSDDALNNPDDRDALLPGGLEDIDFFGDVVRDPYRAYIDSTTRTHLAGPEFGFNYAAGGEHFQLVGETKVGVMGGLEKQRLITKGIGQAYLINQPGGPPAHFNPFYDPELVTADDGQSSFVTPLFQQSFNTSSRPFAYIPLLRSHRLFREAKFKAGWTFLLIGQLQRPNEQILYQSGNGAIPAPLNILIGTSAGDPDLIPEVKKDRSVFFTHYFNLGVEWDF